MNQQLLRQATAALAAGRLKITCAESCTGGLLAAAFTELPGSSAWFETGFVTYSNEAKQRLLDVSAESLRREGAVSETVAREMAAGACAAAAADYALAITGIAGPGGGSAEKPSAQYVSASPAARARLPVPPTSAARAVKSAAKPPTSPSPGWRKPLRSGKDRRRGGTFSDGLCAPLRGKIYRAYFYINFTRLYRTSRWTTARKSRSIRARRHPAASLTD